MKSTRLIKKSQESVLCTLHRKCTNLAFVPKHKTVEEEDILRVQEFVTEARNLLVITGAGISTESGIPDYRSEGVGSYATSTKRPIQHKVFMESPKARQSYWARNFIGWPRWSGFLPNTNHHTLATWEARGKVRQECTLIMHVKCRLSGELPDHPECGPAALQGGQQTRDRAARHQQPGDLHELLLQSAQASVPAGIGDSQPGHEDMGTSRQSLKAQLLSYECRFYILD